MGSRMCALEAYYSGLRDEIEAFHDNAERLQVTAKEIEKISRHMRVTAKEIEIISRHMQVTAKEIEIISRHMQVTAKKIERISRLQQKWTRQTKTDHGTRNDRKRKLYFRNPLSIVVRKQNERLQNYISCS